VFAEEDMYWNITEDYINQRIGEQMLTADQWSSLTADVVSAVYKSQDRQSQQLLTVDERVVSDQTVLDITADDETEAARKT